MKLFALLGLGLVLGLRPPPIRHVIAVTAIAAHAPHLPATWLGIVWGLGHTLTLFAVGAGIILFNWIVPPRVGLTMEFCVAVALVVVGLLNIGGAVDPAPAAVARPAAGRPSRWGWSRLAGSARSRCSCWRPSASGLRLRLSAGVRARHAVRHGAHHHRLRAAGGLGGSPLGRSGIDRRFSTGHFRSPGLWLAYHIGWHDRLFLSTPSWTHSSPTSLGWASQPRRPARRAGPRLRSAPAPWR
jgi:high-affinity nickel-transport protein